MKVFVGQAVTGQDFNMLERDTKKVYSALEKAGYNVCSNMDKEGKGVVKTAGGWMTSAFEELDKSDIFLAIVRTEHRSEGLLMEIGYCLAKKKEIILAINDNVKNTYLPEVVSKTLRWKDFDDLLTKLSKLKVK